MTTVKTATLRPAATGFVSILTQTAKRAFSAVVKSFLARRNRAALLRLGDLDDHMLKDVGITRCDLHRALGHSGVDGPGKALADARARQEAVRNY